MRILFVINDRIYNKQDYRDQECIAGVVTLKHIYSFLIFLLSPAETSNFDQLNNRIFLTVGGKINTPGRGLNQSSCFS